MLYWLNLLFNQFSSASVDTKRELNNTTCNLLAFDRSVLANLSPVTKNISNFQHLATEIELPMLLVIEVPDF